MSINRDHFEWVCEHFVKVIDRIPILQSLVAFSIVSHKKAFLKWLIMVLAASAPVILTVLLSPVPEGNLSFWKKMIVKLTESATVSEQFVYTAGFLAPTLYLVWENFLAVKDQRNNPKHDSPYEKIQNVLKIYRGYGWILFLSLVVLALTALGFSFIKTENPTFQGTFLFKILEEHSPLIYVFSLYAFYLSIVLEIGSNGSFTDTFKHTEKDVKDAFEQRVKQRNSHVQQ